jgi:hypothetical protein
VQGQLVLEKVFVGHKVVHLGITPNLKEVWQSINGSNLEQDVVEVSTPEIDGTLDFFKKSTTHI